MTKLYGRPPGEILRPQGRADQCSGDAQPARGATEPKYEAEFLGRACLLSRGAKDPLSTYHGC